MTKDLKLVGLQYNIAAAVFFVSVCLIDDFDVGSWTHESSDTLQSRRSTIVRAFLNLRSKYPIIHWIFLLNRNIALKLYRPSLWSRFNNF